MGYTSYWSPKKVSAKKFKEFSEMCKKLHDNLPEKTNIAGGYHKDDKLKIGNWEGILNKDNKPEFSENAVVFNGVGELAHETFSIEHNQNDWSFCKTARKPYDLLVCACLLASVDKLGFKFSSDGNLSDWKPAIEYYNKVIDSANVKSKDLAKFKIK